jgi:hypothetical protein
MGRHLYMFRSVLVRLEELERLEKDYLTSKEIEDHENSITTPSFPKERVQQIVAEMGAQMGDRGIPRSDIPSQL